MLQLNADQMDHLSKVVLDNFVRKEADRIRAAFPEDFKKTPQDELIDFVHAGIQQAEELGIEDQGCVREFLDFVCTYGADFAEDEEMAWANSILTNQEMDEFQKMEELDEAETFMAMEEDAT